MKEKDLRSFVIILSTLIIGGSFLGVIVLIVIEMMCSITCSLPCSVWYDFRSGRTILRLSDGKQP